jgi:hypothetical protein
VLDARLFTPLPPLLRRRLNDDYVAFVRERDGEPDLAARTLAKREAWFEALQRRPAPACTGARVAPSDFAAWHRGERSLRDASPLTIWLVAIARANEGEGWGVDYLLDRGGFQGLGRGGVLKPRDFADLEETYHTRIFREIVRLFGLDFELREPPAPIQHSVKVMAHLPERLSFILLAAGELMGTVAFLRLARWGDELLAEQADVQARVRALLDEVLIDEVGHVTYLLGSMSRLELSLVRRLALAYLAYSRRGYGGDHQEPSAPVRDGIANYSLALFPERVLQRAFVPAPYWPRARAPREAAGPEARR